MPSPTTQVGSSIQENSGSSFSKGYMESEHVIDGRGFEAQGYGKHVRRIKRETTTIKCYVKWGIPVAKSCSVAWMIY